MRATILARRPPIVLAAAIAALLLAVAGCAGGGDDETDETPVAASPTPTATEEPTEQATGTITLEDAEQAALNEVGDGEVTWSGPEDDRGAKWEVEVTRPNGSEVDVLVAADGSIVKTIERLRSPGPDAEAPPEPNNPASVTLEEAKAIALAAVGEGTVTWSGPEDDRGAKWEIEVTRPNGSEVDVLVAADGTVVS